MPANNWFCLPCGRSSAEEEDDAPAQRPSPPRIIVTAPTPEPAMPVTTRKYGKKGSKFAAATAASSQPPTNSSRDPLSEITSGLSNIRITIPEIESPEAYIDPNEIPVRSISTRPRAETPPDSLKSATTKGSSADNTSIKSTRSGVIRGRPRAREDEPAQPEVRPSERPLRSQTKRGAEADNSSGESFPIRKSKGKSKEVDQASLKAASIVSNKTASSSSSDYLYIKTPVSKKQQAINAATTAATTAAAPSPITPQRRRSGQIHPKVLLSPHSTPDVPIPEWAQTLAEAYNAGPRSTKLEVQDWNSILEEIDLVEKIAEASYAEVYRVRVASETSILKVITLKPPTGVGSKRFTAMTVPEVLSEFKIMDALSDLDGYLQLKDAHLVAGKPSRAMCIAHDVFRAQKPEDYEGYFPDPRSYPKETMFLVLEMVDAGADLDKFEIDGLVQIFDLFLQIAISLDAGERYFEFEHRDLHENNVCIKRIAGDPVKKSDDEHHDRYKLRHSGYETTILDFTLSRATLNSETTSFDLFKDPAVFEGQGLEQYDVYRNMRTHLLTHTESVTPGVPASWSTYIPYTNVLWLRFILNYMLNRYREGNWSNAEEVVKRYGGWRLEEYQARLVELGELLGMLGEGQWVEGEGKFGSAGDVIEWAIERGWIGSGDRL